MMNNGVYNHAHQSGAGTLTLGAQFLHSVNVGTAGTTVTVADNVGTLAVIGAVTGSFIFDNRVIPPLTVTVVGTADVAVSYV